MAWAVGRSPANQIVSVPLAHPLATKKITQFLNLESNSWESGKFAIFP
jgi:hypothetical protein